MQIGINSFRLNKVLSQDFTAGVLSLKEAGISHLDPLIVFDFGRGLHCFSSVRWFAARGQRRRHVARDAGGRTN